MDVIKICYVVIIVSKYVWNFLFWKKLEFFMKLNGNNRWMVNYLVKVRFIIFKWFWILYDMSYKKFVVCFYIVYEKYFCVYLLIIWESW